MLYQEKVEEYQARDMVKGILGELDENGSVKEGGLQVEDAVMLPEYFKNEDEKKKFEGAKVNDVLILNLSKADENLHQAQIGFREGVLTATNVMEAQTAWLQAHNERIDAGIDVNLCKVYLSKVLGTLDYNY